MHLFIVILLVVAKLKVNALPAGQISGSTHVNISKSIDLPALLNQKLSSPGGRSKGREHATLEHPNWINKKDSIYDNAQQAVIGFLHPKPIVDTIQEHEKYGNNGDQFRSIGNAIVGGYEGFSNFLNSAIDFPFEAMKQVTRKASSYLGNLGAKLIGL